ncbi:hypothetical protein OH768_00935 [Streptomyces sp. NBC_01622]|uniref:hypothetical protein n=1 Tax=Streptomyces sp. NBC_01622 TaxID=2975903 RepID=UPI003870231F|nr:hypothetical protein OH768_00935 [Streptomyces sp. NBC_01622]
MARKPYNMSAAAREARALGGIASATSPTNLITRIERAKANLTPAHIERLRALLASATPKSDTDDS